MTRAKNVIREVSENQHCQQGGAPLLLSSFTCSDEFSSLRLHHNRAITHLMRSARERVRQVSATPAHRA